MSYLEYVNVLDHANASSPLKINQHKEMDYRKESLLYVYMGALP